MSHLIHEKRGNRRSKAPSENNRNLTVDAKGLRRSSPERQPARKPNPSERQAASVTSSALRCYGLAAGATSTRALDAGEGCDKDKFKCHDAFPSVMAWPTSRGWWRMSKELPPGAIPGWLGANQRG
jgi:hypothetical protein